MDGLVIVYCLSRIRPVSHIWGSIVSTKPIIDAGIKWTLGNGKLVDIWKDWWCGDKALAESFLETM